MKDKTFLFADRNMAKARWHVKRHINTSSCDTENGCQQLRLQVRRTGTQIAEGSAPD